VIPTPRHARLFFQGLLGRGGARIAVLAASAFQLAVFGAMLVVTGGCLCTSDGTPPMSTFEVGLFRAMYYILLPGGLVLWPLDSVAPVWEESPALRYLIMSVVMLVNLVLWAGIVRLVLLAAKAGRRALRHAAV
jgi:hypothetical protein